MSKVLINEACTIHYIAALTCAQLELHDPDLANKLRKAIMDYGVYGEWDHDEPLIDVFIITVKDYVGV